MKFISRKQRRAAARQQGVAFVPQYNGPVYKLTLGTVKDKKKRERFGVVKIEEVKELAHV